MWRKVSRKAERGQRGGTSSKLDTEYRGRQGAQGGLSRGATVDEDSVDQTLAGGSQEIHKEKSLVNPERRCWKKRDVWGLGEGADCPTGKVRGRVQERHSERKKGRQS